MRRLFEVNSEPHTGARPSDRLCAGLMSFLTKDLKECQASVMVQCLHETFAAEFSRAVDQGLYLRNLRLPSVPYSGVFTALTKPQLPEK